MHELLKLEQRLFSPLGWYVLVDASNQSPRRCRSLTEVYAALDRDEAPSAAGTLAPGVLGADIDAEHAVVGDAIAEGMVRWCVARQLPYLVRESGRPGGRHVFAIGASVAHIEDWAALCGRLAGQYRTVVDNRTGRTIRLLTARHRLGLPAPVISSTMIAAAIPPPDAFGRTSPAHRGRASSRPRRPEPGAASRSEQEYGQACAMARADISVTDAWARANIPDSKAAERGRAWWLRYCWLPALTIVAAERGIHVDAAWEAVSHACPAACMRMGRRWWNGLWERALVEAATNRPRRYQLTEQPRNLDEQAAITTLSAQLRTAAVATLAAVDPRRRRSVEAVLEPIAAAIVTRNGSISERSISLASRLDRNTVRAAVATATAYGLLVLSHTYAGGSSDCHAYAVGPVAEQQIRAAERTSSPTSCSTPAPLGNCSLTRLRRAYRQDRDAWRTRCDVLAALAPGERLATSRHPAAKLLRSRWAQRRWWNALTPAAQEDRRAQRRAQLDALSRGDYHAWLAWLSVRDDTAQAADRVSARVGDDTDLWQVATVAQIHTFHRGMQAAQWRTAAAAAHRLAKLAA
ncbi:hypothetical protein [Nocardia asiatica]|uniref:hypothetical protein n=1 Tax=Nocardia asiatica TaxID=209252 RepID=UPI003EDF5781